MIFQVTEAVPVMFKGELFWHSANPAKKMSKATWKYLGAEGEPAAWKISTQDFPGELPVSWIICPQSSDSP